MINYARKINEIAYLSIKCRNRNGASVSLYERSSDYFKIPWLALHEKNV